MPNSQPFNWEVSLGRFLDGTLDEGQCARLADMLAGLLNDKSEAGAAQKRLIQNQLVTDFLLHDLEKGGGKSPSALDLFASLSGETPLAPPTKKQDAHANPCYGGIDLDQLVQLAANSPTLPQEKQKDQQIMRSEERKRPASKIGSFKMPTWLRWLAVPCLILFGIIIVHEFRTKPDSREKMTASARILESVEAEWEDEQFKVGREMDPGRMKLKSGLVKIEFADGAVVLIEGPTELFVQEKNKAFCPSGKLNAMVPKKAVGFEIGTPFATIVDLGTTFALEVTPEKTEVHTITGKVEIHKSQLEAIVLSEGRALSLDINGQKKDFKTDPDRFCTEGKFRQRQDAYATKRRETWDRRTNLLENDPSLIYRLRLEEECRPVLVGGSDRERKALRFQSPKHLVDVPVIKECPSLTLLAKVKIGQLPNSSNTLLIGNDFYSEKGEFLWQLDQGGAMQFHLNTDGIGQVQSFDSAPVVTKKDRNTWVSLALVADPVEKTIRHYVDGELVDTVPWEEPQPLRLNGATLGNVNPKYRKTGTRFWSGDIEEFWIFQRAFTSEEIRDNYLNSTFAKIQDRKNAKMRGFSMPRNKYHTPYYRRV